MLPRNDAHDLEGLNLAHFVMPIINTQKVVSEKSSNGFLIHFFHQERWTPIWTQNLKAEVKLLAERCFYWWPEVESNHRHTDFQSQVLVLRDT